MEGVERFMFGQSTLYNGVNVTCALIGLFSMSQVLILAESRIVERAKAKAITDKFRLTRPEMKRITPPVLRSWIIGNIVGILPGAGATIACFMGYNEAKRFSKHKEEFGKGSIEGVAGSESANNAVTGGSLIPTLTLGIPGESVTAVLMGGLCDSRPAARARTFYNIRGHDLHLLCRFCDRAVHDAGDRPFGLQRFCPDFARL